MNKKIDHPITPLYQGCYRCIFYCKEMKKGKCSHYREFTSIEMTLCKLEINDLKQKLGTSTHGTLREKLIREYWNSHRRINI